MVQLLLIEPEIVGSFRLSVKGGQMTNTARIHLSSLIAVASPMLSGARPFFRGTPHLDWGAGRHTAPLQPDGAPWAWAENEFGQLGIKNRFHEMPW